VRRLLLGTGIFGRLVAFSAVGGMLAAAALVPAVQRGEDR
jgi:hypothetical protein